MSVTPQDASRTAEVEAQDGNNVVEGTDAVSAAVRVTDKLCASMDKHGATAWLAGFGAVLIVVALSAQTIPGMSDLAPGEFIAVLICGLVFVLVGAGFRLYRGYVTQKLLDTYFAGLVKERSAEAGHQRSEIERGHERLQTEVKRF
jgi:hypothetical protein